jgi:hypothetical protein
MKFGHQRGLHEQRRAVAAAERDRLRAEQRRARAQHQRPPADETEEKEPNMPPPEKRYKQPDELTVDEIVREMSAKQRGEPMQFETEAYQRYRADALRAAGLNDEADAAEPDRDVDIESMTVEQHFERLRRDR